MSEQRATYDPGRYYSELLRSITEQDVYAVLRVMLNHVGEDNAVHLSDIADQVFGIAYYDDDENGNQVPVHHDRKTRACLETLVTKYGVPIGAYSGKAGRWICASAEEIERVAADLESRVQSTNDRIAALRRIPLPYHEPERAAQRGLWG